ncbi:unnamed protein product [Effrenium voratum]|nr:unnamed protein product [Effrenium voratum]
MEAVCPGYWHPVLKRTKFKSLFSSFDTSSSLTLVQEVLGPLHERCFQQVRAAAPRPEGVRHVEGALLTEARLHAEVVAAYEWHMAAAQLERNNMRSRVENLGPSRAYCQFDFMEKLPIPISGSETSDQFHGSQRKTLSVFKMYAVERSRDGKRQVSAVVLVSEIIELSALFGSLCVLESLNHIQNLGSLDELILGFDTGTHFRSYENLYYFLYKIASEKKQQCRVNYLVEKHGKSMCDSEVFSPIRRWLDEFLLNADAFCDTEEQVVNMLKTYAAREMKQNPGGTKFTVKVFNPAKPRKTWALSFVDDDYITRSYSWEAVPNRNTRFPVRISSCVFSNSDQRHRISYQITERKLDAEQLEWKRGFWQDPTWRKPALALGRKNEILRKHKAQLAAFRGSLQAKRPLTFDELVERDEKRLAKANARSKRKHEAAIASSAMDESSDEL